jgi:hypothetical protein
MSLKEINDWMEKTILPFLLALCFLAFTYVDLIMIEDHLNSDPVTINYLIWAVAFHFGWAVYLIYLTFKKEAGK